MASGVLVRAQRLGGGPADCGCGDAGCADNFAVLAATTDRAARDRMRTRIVEAHLGIAYAIAARHWWPGPDFEDVRQVAALALVEAAARFDPGRGTPFSAYLVPTVAGAVKRHFRDQRWVVQPPRRIKELRLRIRAATDPLTQQLRHVPTPAEWAEYLECDRPEVEEALAAEDAMRPLSLDAPVASADDDEIALGATLGDADGAYDHVDAVLMLGPLLGQLQEREQRMVAMRFAGNLTQSQIAERVGCSQMHVSRILRAALERLRRALQGVPAPDGGQPPRAREDRRVREPAGRQDGAADRVAGQRLSGHVAACPQDRAAARLAANSLLRRDAAVAGPLARRAAAVAGPLARRDAAVAGPLARRDAAVAGPQARRDAAAAAHVDGRSDEAARAVRRRRQVVDPPRVTTFRSG